VKQFADAFSKLLKATGRGGQMSERDPIDFLRVKLMKELHKGRHHS
jgi:hypothetical protein